MTNEKIKNYEFLKEMYMDDYFPDFLVDKCKNILIELCNSIESNKPKSLNELYKLTHKATEKFNDLVEGFEENDSEIETAARDCIGMDFEYIDSPDTEELIAPRDW